MKLIIQGSLLLISLGAAEVGTLKHIQDLATVGYIGLACIALWVAYKAIQMNQD